MTQPRRKSELPARRSNEWVRGFATALAEMLRQGHDGPSARCALKGAGLTIAKLRNAGVFASDVARIENHIAKRPSFEGAEECSHVE